jgi:thioredoxin
VHLTTLNLERFLRDHPRAVVDVWAPWCGPCRAFGPVFAAASRRWGEGVGFGKIHADHEPSLVARFGVRSIPSLLFFRNGQLVRTEVGVLPLDRFERRLHSTFRDLP